MGVNSGLRLACTHMPMDSACIAHALVDVLHGYDIIFMGEQAIDGEGAQVPQRVSVMLDLPCVTGVEELHIEKSGCWGRRVLEGREEIIHFPLPAVVGVNRRLMEPRYPSFRGIMQAKRKSIEVREAVLGKEGCNIVALRTPAEKSAGQRFVFDSEVPGHVVRLLRQEAKVI